MITAEQTVANTGAGAGRGAALRADQPHQPHRQPGHWNVHSGPIGAFGGAVDFGNNYDDVAEAGTVTPEGAAGWIGFTDIYWLSALIPQAGAAAEAISARSAASTIRADLLYDPVTRRPRPAGGPHHRGCSPAPRKAPCSTLRGGRRSPSSAWRSTGAGSAGSRSRSSGCSSDALRPGRQLRRRDHPADRWSCAARCSRSRRSSSPAWRRCARSSPR